MAAHTTKQQYKTFRHKFMQGNEVSFFQIETGAFALAFIGL